MARHNPGLDRFQILLSVALLGNLGKAKNRGDKI
jgi:hypothetical protein